MQIFFYSFSLLNTLFTYNDVKFFFLYKLEKKGTHRSVVDLTSSRFHKPHVNCLAVDANNRQLMTSKRPIGPKKYVNISMSPEKKKEKTLDNVCNLQLFGECQNVIET